MLVFIDTNILLNFYRFDSDVSLDYMEKLMSISERIIMTPIIEMEFLKNRQKVILNTVKQINSPNQISFPEILSKDKTVKSISKQLEQVQEKVNRTKDKMKSLVANYEKKDKVYKNFKKIFTKKDDISLNTTSGIFDDIYLRAKKRFDMGYPPRKSNDINFGDSINWEWIIEVCLNKKSDVIIVTRDSDYGYYQNNTMIMNDWLTEEFKRRIGRNKKVLISRLFTKTLKDYFEVNITKEQIRYEAQHSTEQSELLNIMKYGNFINYFRRLSEVKKHSIIDSIVSFPFK
jgi:predicted nucleic acid-binding protein